VIVVDGLDEWLNLGLSLNLLSAHSSCHLQWVPLNAGYKCMGEFLVLDEYINCYY
jgi:hypothetical protein